MSVWSKVFIIKNCDTQKYYTDRHWERYIAQADKFNSIEEIELLLNPKDEYYSLSCFDNINNIEIITFYTKNEE